MVDRTDDMLSRLNQYELEQKIRMPEAATLPGKPEIFGVPQPKSLSPTQIDRAGDLACDAVVKMYDAAAEQSLATYSALQDQLKYLSEVVGAATRDCLERQSRLEDRLNGEIKRMFEDHAEDLRANGRHIAEIVGRSAKMLDHAAKSHAAIKDRINTEEFLHEDQAASIPAGDVPAASPGVSEQPGPGSPEVPGS